MSLSEALPTTAIDTVSEFTRRRVTTASEGLVQGAYVAVRAGIEPASLRSKNIDPANTPPRPKMEKHMRNTFSTVQYSYAKLKCKCKM